jgi:hypothetical protein
VLAIVLALGVLLISRPATGQEKDAKVNPTGAAMKGFLDRVNEYIALQKKLDDGLPKLKTREDTGKIEEHQAALAERIREARKDAKPGDVFGDTASYFRDTIRNDASWRSSRDKKASMEEVPPQNPPRVNAAYPENKPLATMPPLILTMLQPLPEGIEYRFMGRDLILRDVKANIIVDFITEAVPTSKR